MYKGRMNLWRTPSCQKNFTSLHGLCVYHIKYIITFKNLDLLPKNLYCNILQQKTGGLPDEVNIKKMSVVSVVFMAV